MFTKVNGIIEVASGAPVEAHLAGDKFAHLMHSVDSMTADEMADTIDKNYDVDQTQSITSVLRKWTTTINIMNPAAGEIAIRKNAKGGVCDIGTESYWSV